MGKLHLLIRVSSLATMSAMAAVAASSAFAEQCRFEGAVMEGVDPRLMVDSTCSDPDYNETTFVVDRTTQKIQDISPTEHISYTEVQGHFPATRTRSTLLPGATGSPTLAQHGVTWRFPDKPHFQYRFFQSVYPIGGGFVDPNFAFTHGGYIVNVTPGTPSVGYRVDAAAAKLAKAYASRLYGNSSRIYGYIFGVSGGSVQTIGAAEGTTGVWDGAMPISLATHSLNVHSFPWDGHYALAVPQSKRQMVAKAVAPNSGMDIYAGLTTDERAALNELIKAGFSRKALENNPFQLFMTTILAGNLPTTDPTYVDDFWSKPGYEGYNPPSYLSAAKVDGYATITAIHRDATGAPTSIDLDPSTVPKLGSTGDVGLEYYVYAADGKSRTIGVTGDSLVGSLKDATFTIVKPVQSGFIPAGPPTDSAVLNALAVGGKIRINNRFLLAVCFYPRYTALNNGNPGYNQYRNADGSWKYPQRPVSIAFKATAGTGGGAIEEGAIRFKTIIIENLVDPSSFPYVGAFYFSQIRKSLGAAKADQMARIYYNDNADHASFGAIRGNDASMLVGFGGIVQQALVDLSAWVEKGVAPPASTQYTIDSDNQVVLPSKASQRRGIQPVVTLTANGASRVEVSVGQPVELAGHIETPPGGGTVMQYDWYLGEKVPVVYEPSTALAKPKPSVDVYRKVTFSTPGSYLVTLRTAAQRTGMIDGNTSLENLARVRVVVMKHGSKINGNTTGTLSSTISDNLAGSGGLSVDRTPIGEILDNPAAMAVLTKNAPGLTRNDSLSAWRNLTLRDVQKLVGQSLRDEQLDSIQRDFDRLPPK